MVPRTSLLRGSTVYTNTTKVCLYSNQCGRGGGGGGGGFPLIFTKCQYAGENPNNFEQEHPILWHQPFFVFLLLLLIVSSTYLGNKSQPPPPQEKVFPYAYDRRYCFSLLLRSKYGHHRILPDCILRVLGSLRHFGPGLR